MNRGRPWVGGLVALCLGAVIYLIATAPVGADPPTSVFQTTLEDFNAGTFFHTGLTMADDGEVQLLVVGLAGDWITETNTTGLPALDRHTAVQHSDHILVLGGRKSTFVPTRDVYYTTIDPETHDLANWQLASNPLPSGTYPNGLQWHASAVVHDRVYVMGGMDSSTVFDAVTFAPIEADGDLGAWQTTTPLSVPLRLLQAVVVSDTIYVIGGWDNTDTERAEVYFAQPNPATGLISSWTQTTDFVHPTFGHMAAADGGRIYVMGGYHPDLLNKVSPYTHYSDVHPQTGQVTGWTQTTNMAFNIYGGAGLGYHGQLYTTGGAKDNVTTPSDYVGSSLIDPSGGVTSWYDTSVIEPARFYHAAVHSRDGWLYVINGNNGFGPIDPPSINRGATTGAGDQYAADGTFTSAPFDLGETKRLLELRWNATITNTDLMTITMRYRTKASEIDPWSAWSSPHPSSSTPGTVTSTLAVAGSARYVQYEAYFGTDILDATPVLHAVELRSYKPTYEMEITKDSWPAPGTVVSPGQTIQYSLTYSNSVWSVVANNATILDAPPRYTTYAPGTIWGPGADDSDPDLLRWALGNLDPGEGGTVGYSVVVTNVIEEVTVIENHADLTSDDGPTMVSNLVTHTLGIPELELVVTKEAMPLAGSTLEPGSLITYSLTYENPSLAYANHPMLTDTHDVHDSYDILSNDPPPNAGPSVWDLGVLAPGAQGEITIVVRLSDTLPNNWIVSNQASLKSPESSITFSDVATHLVVYEGVDLTDLIVEEIRWEPADPEPQQPVQFYATVANTGTLDATDPFWVSLYIKPSPSEPPFGPSDHDYGYCLDGCAVTRPNYLYYVGELLQGERVEAWFQGEDVVFPSGGFYDVYVQVDVAFDHPDYNWYWGVYPEANEYNNVGTSQTYLEGLFTLYLPLIRRD